MKERPRILITEHAERRAEGISDLLEKAGAQTKLVKLYQENVDFKSLDFDALIVTGGPMGVYDMDKTPYDFLKKEVNFIAAAISKNKAVLGICLGHQLVAHTLGGRIELSFPNEEIGWKNIRVNRNGKKDPLFHNIPEVFSSFEYHKDVVVSLPSDSILLASSSTCKTQAFRYCNKPVWGVQFHPEISAEKAQDILESRRDYLTEKGINVYLAIRRGYNVSHEPRKQIFINFVNLLE